MLEDRRCPLIERYFCELMGIVGEIEDVDVEPEDGRRHFTVCEKQISYVNLFVNLVLTRRMTLIYVTEVPVEGKHVFVALAYLLVAALTTLLVLVVSSTRFALFFGDRLLSGDSRFGFISINLTQLLLFISRLERGNI